MNRYTKLATVGGLMAAVVSAHAIPIGADRLLGTIVPGTPANPTNENEMVNFLVEAYNSNPAPRSLGDNPDDPQTEVYALTSGSAIPAGPLPAASLTGSVNVTTSNTTFDLGLGGFNYITAKFGQDSEVFYLGGLTGEITLGNFTGNQNGLSGYTLFNPGPGTQVPDGGVTIALLGLSIAGLGLMRRKVLA